jgi:hypothetical protein
MRILLALTIAFFLALAAQATAKGIMGAKACGADGCVRFGHVAGGDAALMGGPPMSAPTQKAGFFRIRFKVGEDGSSFGFVRNVYVPSQQALRSDDGTWMEPAPQTLAALNRMVRGLRPYPAAKMPGVLVPYRGTTAAATPAPPRPASDGDDGGGPPAVLWAAIGAVVLAALAAAGWHRHGPVEAG